MRGAARPSDTSGDPDPGAIRRGTYLLWLTLERDRRLVIGRLGDFVFEAGDYVYVGRHARALGPRVRRHLAGTGRVRWHVDYLRRATTPRGALVLPDRLDECVVVARLVEMGGRRHPPGFGASDCRCPGHLVFFTGFAPERVTFRALWVPVSEAVPGSG